MTVTTRAQQAVLVANTIFVVPQYELPFLRYLLLIALEQSSAMN
jgi:hypothetical protein